MVSVAAALLFYGKKKEGTKAAALTGQHITHLLRHWKGKVLSQITEDACKAYVKDRTTETYAAPGSNKRKNISVSTARRELGALNAAITSWHKTYTLTAKPVVSLPSVSDGHADWLTHVEFARLSRAAAGYAWVATDVATREPIWARAPGWAPEDAKNSDHLVRFCHVAFYSGTRSAAVLDLRWRRHRTAGYVDIPSLTLFRCGTDVVQSNKRATPCRIHEKLLPLLLEWREADLEAGVSRVIHDRGVVVKRISKGFRAAAMRACLDRREIDGTYRVGGKALTADVDDEDGSAEEVEDDADHLGWPTPHILRHTRATLMLQAGVSPHEVGEYLGLSMKMVLERYGHTSSEYQKRAAAA